MAGSGLRYCKVIQVCFVLPLSLFSMPLILCLSLASGLDLSGLFEGCKRKLGTFFVTKCSTKEAMKNVV